MALIKGTDVRNMFGVTRLTLWRYVKDGKLTPHKVSKSLYLYDEEEVYRLLGKVIPTGTDVVIYARVQGAGQKDELQDQIKRLNDFAARNGMSVSKSYWDCAKSLDFSRENRKGLYELMLDVYKRKVGLVIIESPDRVAQIGHEMFKMMLSNYRVRIIYVSQDPVNPRYLEETTRELAGTVRAMRKQLDLKRPRTTGFTGVA